MSSWRLLGDQVSGRQGRLLGTCCVPRTTRGDLWVGGAAAVDTTFATWFPGERNYVPGSLVTYDANGSPQP